MICTIFDIICTIINISLYAEIIYNFLINTINRICALYIAVPCMLKKMVLRGSNAGTYP
jgi:hypothetical protein